MGLQYVEFAVPNKNFSVRFDTQIPHAENPEYKALFYL